jgi:hypothetical protein
LFVNTVHTKMRLLCLGFACYVYEVLLVLVVCARLCYQVLYMYRYDITKVVRRAQHSVMLRRKHYTTRGIASYEALQKRSFKKPWYCLNVQCILQTSCRICLFCKLHPLYHPLHSRPYSPNSSSSFFLLCFILSPLPPSHSGECSIGVL